MMAAEDVSSAEVVDLVTSIEPKTPRTITIVRISGWHLKNLTAPEELDYT